MRHCQIPCIPAANPFLPETVDASISDTLQAKVAFHDAVVDLCRLCSVSFAKIDVYAGMTAGIPTIVHHL
jgi:hypothetical protein